MLLKNKFQKDYFNMPITRPIPADLYNILKDIDTASSNAKTTANNAQTAANNAQTVASTAQTTANNAQTAANNAQGTATQAVNDAQAAKNLAQGAAGAAQNAVGRLAGDNDYFEGTGTFTGTPSGLLIASITTLSAVGINYTAGYFNFSYLGKYLVHITQMGDCVNNRSDWYQEVTMGIKDVISGVTVPLTFKSIPPSGTWNMENSGTNIIDVVGGSQWKPRVNMTANGSTTNGQFRIKIKKVV